MTSERYATLILIIVSSFLISLRALGKALFELDFEVLIFHLPALLLLIDLMLRKSKKNR